MMGTLEAIIEAEDMEECSLLTLFSWVAQAAFLSNPGSCTQVLYHPLRTSVDCLHLAQTTSFRGEITGFSTEPTIIILLNGCSAKLLSTILSACS